MEFGFNITEQMVRDFGSKKLTDKAIKELCPGYMGYAVSSKRVSADRNIANYTILDVLDSGTYTKEEIYNKINEFRDELLSNCNSEKINIDNYDYDEEVRVYTVKEEMVRETYTEVLERFRYAFNYARNYVKEQDQKVASMHNLLNDPEMVALLKERLGV